MNVIRAVVAACTWSVLASPLAYGLERGSILVGDQDRDALIIVDPISGSQSIVSQGGAIANPFGLIASGTDTVMVSDTPGGLFTVDVRTGEQTPILNSVPHFTRAIAIDAAGELIVAGIDSPGSGAVSRVNLTSGMTTSISVGGFLDDPDGLIVAPNGDLILGNFFGPYGADTRPVIVRINPITGEQTPVSNGGILQEVSKLALDGLGNLYAVGNVYNGSPAGVFRIDMVTGDQTLVSSGGFLDEPFGLAVDINGDLIVSDRGTSSVFRVDPVTGSQSLISQGAELSKPISVAVVTVSEPTSGLLFLASIAIACCLYVLRKYRRAVNASKACS